MAAPFDRLSATLTLDESAQRVQGVSAARQQILAKRDIVTVRDLITQFPRRYIDLSKVETIGSATIGSSCTICGTVHEVLLKEPKPRLKLVEITLLDSTGVLIVTMFSQPWLARTIQAGARLAVAGTLEFNFGYKRMTNPFLDVLEGDEELTRGKIVPVHRASEKISVTWMRRLIANALELVRGLYDPLPLAYRVKYRLMSRQCALRCVHFPRTMDEVREAKRRLIYEELLLLELFLKLSSMKRSKGVRPCVHCIDGPHNKALAQAIPFTLTDEQLQARDDLLAVMAAPRIANHLILGDAGTGKTVIAAFGLAAAKDSAGQALFMAPTEVLVHQHGESLGPLLEKASISYGVLTSATPPQKRRELLESFADGTTDVLIGTHALLEDDVSPKNLSFVVIDEQQRFGVEQRARLLSKGVAPDALYLSATPIPRSLALAIYGDLTLSYLIHSPIQTAPRTTVVLPRNDQGKAFDAALEALERGEQVYVVCPLIGKPKNEGKTRKNKTDKTDAPDTMLFSIEDEGDFAGENVAAARTEAKMLQETLFADYRVALLHGAMTSSEKQAIMDEFRRGAVDVLVTTTIVEVGLDVPNATVMIVEDADRFGLAQLHQLRGRVGRGKLPGFAYLISASKQREALSRLEAMESTDNGFDLASFDLSLRHEGDILGNRQHGTSTLKLVNVIRDGAIIEVAHNDAEAILRDDPTLSRIENRLLAREIRLVFKRETTLSGG